MQAACASPLRTHHLLSAGITYYDCVADAAMLSERRNRIIELILLKCPNLLGISPCLVRRLTTELSNMQLLSHHERRVDVVGLISYI